MIWFCSTFQKWVLLYAKLCAVSVKVELYPAQKLNFVHALYLTKQQKQKKSKLKKYPSRPYPCWKIAFPLSSLGFFLSQQLTVMDTIDTHYYQQITVDFSLFLLSALASVSLGPNHLLSIFRPWLSSQISPVI